MLCTEGSKLWLIAKALEKWLRVIELCGLGERRQRTVWLSLFDISEGKMQLLYVENQIAQCTYTVAFYYGSTLYLMTLFLFLRELPFEM